MVIVRVERTGGIAGISQYSEMNSDDLPTSLKTTLSKVVNDNIGSANSLKSIPKGAADHYTYKITVDDGSNQKVIECNQYDIHDNLKSLVTYVEKHNKNK